jgi:hypothetical protein
MDTAGTNASIAIAFAVGSGICLSSSPISSLRTSRCSISQTFRTRPRTRDMS